MEETEKIQCTLEDSRFAQQLACQYHLDSVKDIDLLTKLHDLGSVLNVYNAKVGTLDSMIEYAQKLKEFITSKEYQQMDKQARANFENRTLRILKNIYVKGVGSEYFVIEPYKSASLSSLKEKEVSL